MQMVYFKKNNQKGVCRIETIWSKSEDLLTRGADGEWEKHLVFF